jgi:hypothetical protein
MVISNHRCGKGRYMARLVMSPAVCPLTSARSPISSSPSGSRPSPAWQVAEACRTRGVPKSRYSRRTLEADSAGNPDGSGIMHRIKGNAREKEHTHAFPFGSDAETPHRFHHAVKRISPPTGTAAATTSPDSSAPMLALGTSGTNRHPRGAPTAGREPCWCKGIMATGAVIVPHLGEKTPSRSTGVKPAVRMLSSILARAIPPVWPHRPNGRFSPR